MLSLPCMTCVKQYCCPESDTATIMLWLRMHWSNCACIDWCCDAMSLSFRAVVSEVQGLFPDSALMAAGWSLGGELWIRVHAQS